MFKNPYFTGIAGGVKSVDKIDVLDLFKRAGANTGNYLFVSAIRNILGKKDTLFQHQADVKFCSEKFDHIVVSAANWVNPGVDLENLCRFIESTDLPCLVVGLGAQVEFGGKLPSLKPGTQRFLDVVSERSSFISVRGKHTQEILGEYGVENTWVTGCPSILGANLEFDPASVQVKKKISIDKVVLQGTRHGIDLNVLRGGHVPKLNLQLYRTAFQNQMPLLLQSELPDIYHAMGRINNKEIIDSGRRFLERVYGADLKEVSSYLNQQAMIFWTVQEWLSELSNFDFLVGNRIHGVVSSLLSGTPSVLLAHDHRTRELAEFMNIPFVDMRDIEKIDCDEILRIIDEVEFSSFVNGYQEYKKNFVEFFDQNSVQHYLK